MEAPSIKFATTAQVMGDHVRAAGLMVPGFRSPPQVIGFGRTVRRRKDGSVVVAVAIRNRPWPAVVSDMIEGVVVANQLAGADAARLRDDLWSVAAPALNAAA